MAVTHTCETLPADPKAAIRRIKQELRAQIGDVQAVFDRLTARIAARLEEIDALKGQRSGRLANDPVRRYCPGPGHGSPARAHQASRLRRYQGPFFSRTGAGVGQRNARVSRPQPFR